MIERLSGETLVYESEQGEAVEKPSRSAEQPTLAELAVRLDQLKAEIQWVNGGNQRLRAE